MIRRIKQTYLYADSLPRRVWALPITLMRRKTMLLAWY